MFWIYDQDLNNFLHFFFFDMKNRITNLQRVQIDNIKNYYYILSFNKNSVWSFTVMAKVAR